MLKRIKAKLFGALTWLLTTTEGLLTYIGLLFAFMAPMDLAAGRVFSAIAAWLVAVAVLFMARRAALEKREALVAEYSPLIFSPTDPEYAELKVLMHRAHLRLWNEHGGEAGPVTAPVAGPHAPKSMLVGLLDGEDGLLTTESQP